MTTLVLTDPVTGTIIDAGAMATNFANLRTVINGGIQDANVASNAALAVSKLAPGSNGQALVTSGGATAWGSALPGAGTVTSAMIVDGTIVDADINAGAAIALSKLASLVLRGPNATQYRFAFGTSSGVTNPNTYGPVAFGITFSSAPTVFINGKTGVGSFGTVSDPATMTVSTTTFTIACGGAGADAVSISWLAIGPA